MRTAKEQKQDAKPSSQNASLILRDMLLALQKNIGCGVTTDDLLGQLDTLTKEMQKHGVDSYAAFLNEYQQKLEKKFKSRSFFGVVIKKEIESVKTDELEKIIKTLHIGWRTVPEATPLSTSSGYLNALRALSQTSQRNSAIEIKQESSTSQKSYHHSINSSPRSSTGSEYSMESIQEDTVMEDYVSFHEFIQKTNEPIKILENIEGMMNILKNAKMQLKVIANINGSPMNMVQFYNLCRRQHAEGKFDIEKTKEAYTAFGNAMKKLLEPLTTPRSSNDSRLTASTSQISSSRAPSPLPESEEDLSESVRIHATSLTLGNK